MFFGTPSELPTDDGYFYDFLLFNVTGTDPYGEKASFLFELTVIENQSPKQVKKLSNYTYTNGTAFVISLEGIFTDPDKD